MTFLNDNKFFLSNAQSGFRLSDSCECQLLSIVPAYNLFKCNLFLQIRNIFRQFLAFERV